MSPARPAGPGGLLDRPTMALAWHQIRRSGKFWLAALVSLAPIAAGIISVAADGVAESRPGEHEFQAGFREPWVFAVAFTALPLAALLLAGGLVADDVEDRTLSYLLVRPVPRGRLYLSKLVPVALTTAAFGVAQTLGLGLARVVSWLLYGIGDTEFREVSARRAQDYLESGAALPTVDTGLALLLMILGAVVAAALLGAVLAALFGFVSLCTTRFHFIANVGVMLAIEIPFSQLGGLGLGFLTASYHALSIAGSFDPTQGADLVPDAAPAWVAIPLAAALAAAWTWLGVRRMRRRDFNVTSAAT